MKLTYVCIFAAIVTYVTAAPHVWATFGGLLNSGSAEIGGGSDVAIVDTESNGQGDYSADAIVINDD
ncbi:hypothetical protein BGZ59_006458 [Podila verticillata]|nr:hypothetical protein BGZ59_006458 [Podila verticillata]